MAAALLDKLKVKKNPKVRENIEVLLHLLQNKKGLKLALRL